MAGPIAGILADDLEAAVAGGDGVEIDGGGEPARPTQDHIGRAGEFARAVLTRCANGQVVDSVAVDVACRRHGDADGISRVLAQDLEAAAIGGDRGKLDRVVESATSSEHHIDRAGEFARAVLTRCANGQVVDSVAVDVTCRHHGDAGAIALVLAQDLEATAAGGDRGEVDGACEAIRPAEYDISRPRTHAAEIRGGRSDDQIIDAISIDIARRRYRIAHIVIGALAENPETSAAGGDGAEIDRTGEAVAVAEHHVCRTDIS